MLRPHALLLIAFSLLLFISYVPTPTSTSQATYHSLSLNGSSGHVTVPNSTSVNISGPITIEAWIKVNAITGNYQDIVCRESYGQAGTGGGYEFAITSTGKVRLDLYQSHNQYTTVSGSTTITTGTWHHVAGVFDGNQMRVYLNGVLDGSLSTTNGPASGTSPLNIGKSTYTTYYFGGLIDQVRISAAALYSSNFTPGLGPANQTRALWKFDGQTPNDVSGNGNHGTLQSGASYSTDVPSGTNNAPAVTLTHPQNNTSIAAGSTVMIDAAATDGDGVVTKVDFYQGTTLLGSDTSAPYTFAWNNVSGGVYSITAKATDDNGAVTTSSAITVNVLDSLTLHSLSLNGTSGYVTVPNSTSVNISGPITIEAWIKVNAITGNYQDIVCRESYGQAGTGGGYEFAITSTGKVRLDLYQSHNQYTTVSGSTTVTTGTWHHVAGVFDGNQMRVYLNGVLDGSLSTTNGPASGTSPLNIGKSTYTTYYFGGLIDEVRISAAALYSANFTPGLGPANQTRAFWRFDGQTANDSSGNGNHGTVQSGATYSTTVPPQSGGQRPIPVANGPYNGLTAQAVQFSSSGSADPDGTISSYHWNFGDGTFANTANPSHTYTAPGLYTATLTVTDNAGQLASATASVNIAGSSNARVDPVNQTGGGGENALSRNFNWGLPLVNLPGRAGLDLSLTLSYNSLVWTKTGNFISFDDDQGFPSPGFRLGFPVIQPLYYNQEVGKYAYLLIGSDGSRTELRQVGASALFESADSAHILLDTSLSLPAPDNDKFILKTTDGTQLFYALKGLNYHCTQVKDRNGNYISINYNLSNQIDTVVDTLNRTVKFNYDPNGWLLSITQIWKQGTANETTHTYASLAYTDVTFQTSFTNLTVVGASNGTTRKMLSKITLDDNSPTPSNNSRFEFAYTSWGQVWKISNFAADNRLLNYRSYNLSGWNNPPSPEAQTDCPRFTERRDWAENWNRSGTPASGYMLPTGAEQEVVTTFTPAQPGTASVPGQSPQVATVVQVTNPDLTFTKIYFLGTSGTDSGWKVGLPYLVESYDVGGSIPQRQAVTNWTQDDDTSSFVTNPRVLETNVYDPAGNRKRTEIVYHQYVLGNGMTCQLPEDIREYDANASSVLRTTRTIYEEDAVYLSRRIIGLPKQRSVYAGLAPSGTLQSKIEFIYDQTAIEGTTDPAAIQHDNANFGMSFLLGRGNLSSVRRYDMDAPTQFTTTATNKYNRVGLLVASKDADDHEVTVSYADSFASNGTATDSNPQDAARLFTTLAYQTTITDADGNSTKLRYNYDFGALTWQQTPQPNLTTYTPGPIQTFTFDVIGRLARTTSLTDNAFTRYNYGLNYIETFSSVNTVVETANEGHSLRVFDGHGRVIATASDHPNTTPSRPAPVGDFSAQLVLYDRMGRVQKRSNPTETGISIGGTPINPSQFSPLGDDAIANGGFGWKYVQQTYDWKGRPLVTTNQDGTTKTAAYTGCGCAGGEVVTVTDEGTIDAGVAKRRQQKIYSDVLSRVRKTEILTWDGPGPNGTGGSVYSATVNTYNARDQITQVREYVGAEGSGTYQDTSMTYDGYGRVKTKRVPEQNPGTATTWDYNADDTIQKVTDARGASQTFVYNDRRLVTSITYAVPGGSGINVPATVSFTYDAAGNRTQMADGFGNHTYQYNQLSRLTQESRQFPVGTFSISYSYNLAGQLTGLTDPFGAGFTYTRDVQGRFKALTGTPYAGFTSYISDVQYRAWGAAKSITYNGSNSTIAYNSRMQPTQFRLTANGTGASIMREDYSYFADGTLSALTDLDDTAGSNPPLTLRYLSRAYRYNQVGRVTSSFGTGGAGQGVPYNQGYSYDAFGHMTSRSGVYYSYNSNPFGNDTASYANNRRSNWAYNAEGQVISTPSTSTDLPRTMTYDAAGRLLSSVESGPLSTTTYSSAYEGDGKLVRETSSVSPGTSQLSYIVRSTVLGGEVLTRLDSSGNKLTTHVPAEGLLFATQRSSGAPGPFVMLTHRNPLGITETNKAVYDPLGSYIPFQAYQDPRPPAGSYNSASMGGLSSSQANPDSYAVGCIMDGLPTACNRVMQAINRDQARSVSIRGLALTPSLMRLMASFLPVNYTRRVSLQEDGSISDTITPGGETGNSEWGFEDNYASWVITKFVYAPGGQSSFEQTGTASKNIASGAGSSQGLNTGRKAEFSYGKFLGCLKKFFPNLASADDGRTRSLSFQRSTGGSFVGMAGGKVLMSRTETNSYTSASLGQMLQTIGVGSGKPNSGATFANYPERNYVASDLAADKNNTDIGVFAIFIHETANSIGDQYGLADPYGGYAKENAKHGITDPDVGAAFETCVFGGLVGVKSGQVGNRREFP